MKNTKNISKLRFAKALTFKSIQQITPYRPRLDLAILSVIFVNVVPQAVRAQVTHLDSSGGGPANVVVAEQNGNIAIPQNLSVGRNVDVGYLLMRPQAAGVGGGFRLLGDTANPTWFVESRSGVLRFSAATPDVPQLSLNRNGSVGIGTASSQGTLEVNGSVLTKNLRLTAGPALGSYISSAAKIHIQAESDALHLNPGGNVPVVVGAVGKAPLEAAGNFRVRGSATFDGPVTLPANSSFAGNVTLPGNVSVAGNLSVTKPINFVGAGRFDAGDSITIQTTNNKPLFLNPFKGGDVVVGSFDGDRVLRVVGKVSASTVELTSDRNAKTGFHSVHSRETLEKLSRIPITTWHYTNCPGVRHIGPMAQDFNSAFNIGEDDKHISVVDGLGVALAAIQGLNETVHEKDLQIRSLQQQVAEMRGELISLESGLSARSGILEEKISKGAVLPANLRN